MEIVFISLFPDQLKTFFEKGITGRAIEKDAFSVRYIQLRDFAEEPHFKVDEYPYGKKHGMLLRADVLSRAIRSVDQFDQYQILYTCPKGRLLDQRYAEELKVAKGLIVISGFYEGVDERIFDMFSIQRVSLGSFVLSSGDVAALAVAEAVTRLLPSVVGKATSVAEDSFVMGLLEHPNFTAPREIEGHSVPDVLVSGNHQKISEWKHKQSLSETLFKRPDLLGDYEITSSDQRQISELFQEEEKSEKRD